MPLFDRRQIIDPRDLWQPPGGGGTSPPPQGPLPTPQPAPPQDEGVPKPPPEQFAGPVEEVWSGQAQAPVDPRLNPQPPGDARLFPGPFPSEATIPGFAREIDGRISNRLLEQDPFPQELVPPFSVEGGLAQDGSLFDSIFGGEGQGFQQAQGAVARAGQANVDLSQFDPTTREVQDEELVSEQLTDLLDSDNAFIQNARQRGREAAQDRGALSSSIFAGSSERAAIEAGLPIASADAQAFITAASENMAAVNQNTLAKLNSATQQAVTNAQNVTQASISTASNRTSASATNAQVSGRQREARIQFETNRIMADSRERIAETQLNAQYSMQQGQFVQQQAMEQLQQQGRVDLTQLQGNIQSELQRQGFGHEIDMSRLSQAQRIELQELFEQPRFEAEMEFSRSQAQGQLAANFFNNFAQGMASMNGLDLDADARTRGHEFWNNFLRTGLNLARNVGSPDQWDDINLGDQFGG